MKLKQLLDFKTLLENWKQMVDDVNKNYENVNKNPPKRLGKCKQLSQSRKQMIIEVKKTLDCLNSAIYFATDSISFIKTIKNSSISSVL